MGHRVGRAGRQRRAVGLIMLPLPAGEKGSVGICGAVLLRVAAARAAGGSGGRTVAGHAPSPQVACLLLLLPLLRHISRQPDRMQARRLSLADRCWRS